MILWGGVGVCSFLPLWSFRTVQRKNAVYLGRHRNHPPLWNQHAVWTSGVRSFFDVYRFQQLALSCQPLCNCAGGRFVTLNFSIAQLCEFFQIWVAEESCAWCGFDLVFNAAQMCCLSFHCVLVGCIPILLFTDIRVQDWFTHEWSLLTWSM